MRFTLIDRITNVQPGTSITAEKTLWSSEEYLKDHFPRFPVMPGVLMLEAMYQASALLVYKTEDFCHSTILLKEARNVKYADFVQPGQTLVVQADLIKIEESTATLNTRGFVGDASAVSGKLVLEKFNIAERLPQRVAWDEYSRRKMLRLFDSLLGAEPSSHI